MVQSGDELKSFGPPAEAPRLATEARSVMRHAMLSRPKILALALALCAACATPPSPEGCLPHEDWIIAHFSVEPYAASTCIPAIYEATLFECPSDYTPNLTTRLGAACHAADLFPKELASLGKPVRYSASHPFEGWEVRFSTAEDEEPPRGFLIKFPNDQEQGASILPY